MERRERLAVFLLVRTFSGHGLRTLVGVVDVRRLNVSVTGDVTLSLRVFSSCLYVPGGYYVFTLVRRVGRTGYRRLLAGPTTSSCIPVVGRFMIVQGVSSVSVRLPSSPVCTMSSRRERYSVGFSSCFNTRRFVKLLKYSCVSGAPFGRNSASTSIRFSLRLRSGRATDQFRLHIITDFGGDRPQFAFPGLGRLVERCQRRHRGSSRFTGWGKTTLTPLDLAIGPPQHTLPWAFSATLGQLQP